MKPGYYWARVKANISFRPKPEPMEVGESGLVWAIAYDDSYRQDELEFFGPCKPPGIRVARVQAPLRTTIDHSLKLSWAVNVPAVKSKHANNGDGDGKAWGWIVRASSYPNAIAVFRETFGFKRVPWGTTFTRLPTDDS